MDEPLKEGKTHFEVDKAHYHLTRFVNFSYSAFAIGVNQRSLSIWIYNIKTQIDVHSLNNAYVIFSSSQD